MATITYQGPLPAGTTPILSGVTFTITQTATYTFNLYLAKTIGILANAQPSVQSSQNWVSPPSGGNPIPLSVPAGSTTLLPTYITYTNVSLTNIPGFTIAVSSVATNGTDGETIECIVNPDGSLMISELPTGVSVSGTPKATELVSLVNDTNNALSVAISQLPSGACVQFPINTATFSMPGVASGGHDYVISFTNAPGADLTVGAANIPPSANGANGITGGTGQITISSTPSGGTTPVQPSVSASIGLTSSNTGFTLTSTNCTVSILAPVTPAPGGTTSVYVNFDGSLEVWQLAPGMTVSGANPTYRIQDKTRYSLSFKGGTGGVQLNEPSGGLTYDPPKGLTYSVAITDDVSGSSTSSFDINTNMGSVDDPTLINEPPQM